MSIKTLQDSVLIDLEICNVASEYEVFFDLFDDGKVENLKVENVVGRLMDIPKRHEAAAREVIGDYLKGGMR